MSSFGAIAAMPADREVYELHARTSAFVRRVAVARSFAREAFTHGGCVISSSWGKDSTALCDLVLDTVGHVPILHLASVYRLPGWERVHEHFAARTDVHVIDPKRTLAETIAWLRDVGLGFERTRSQSKISHRAKSDSGAHWCAERGVRVQFLGMRIDEGGPRARVLRSRGAVYARADGSVIACPLARWTSRDVWAWIVSRGLPYHPLYDCETHGQTRETLRNTGWLTTIDVPDGRLVWLRSHYPEQWRRITAEFPRLGQVS